MIGESPTRPYRLFVIPPVEVQSYQITSMVGMTIKFPLSQNMQLVDTVLSSSINAGAGMPSVKVEGTDLVYRVPGPFVPGQEVQMPQVRLQVALLRARARMQPV